MADTFHTNGSVRLIDSPARIQELEEADAALRNRNAAAAAVPVM